MHQVKFPRFPFSEVKSYSGLFCCDPFLQPGKLNEKKIKEEKKRKKNEKWKKEKKGSSRVRMKSKLIIFREPNHPREAGQAASGDAAR